MDPSLETTFSSVKRWNIQYSKWNNSIQEARPLCLKLEHSVPNRNISTMKFVICLFPKLTLGEMKIMGNIGTQKLQIDENFFCKITYRLINNLTNTPITRDSSSTFSIKDISSGKTTLLENLHCPIEEDSFHTIEFKFIFSLTLEDRTDALISLAQNITRYLQDNKSNYDVTIKCQEKNFQANGLLLIGKSHTFEELITKHKEKDGQSIILLNEYSPGAVEEMLNYVVTSRLSPNLDGNTILDLMHMADIYSLQDLFLECMIQTDYELGTFDPFGALGLMGKKNVGNTMKNLLFNGIAKDFEEIVQTQAWSEFQVNNPIVVREFLYHLIRKLTVLKEDKTMCWKDTK